VAAGLRRAALLFRPTPRRPLAEAVVGRHRLTNNVKSEPRVARHEVRLGRFRGRPARIRRCTYRDANPSAPARTWHREPLGPCRSPRCTSAAPRDAGAARSRRHTTGVEPQPNARISAGIVLSSSLPQCFQRPGGSLSGSRGRPSSAALADPQDPVPCRAQRRPERRGLQPADGGAAGQPQPPAQDVGGHLALAQRD
jgi:hypothetical protein